MNIVRGVFKKPAVPGILFAVLVILATLPLYVSGYTIVLLGSILMYIILAVSWAIFSGPTGYLSLATAAFFGVGIYISAILGGELPLLVVIVVGGLASGCIALLVGALTLRLRGVYFAIFTFGLVELTKNFILWWERVISDTRGRFVVIIDNDTIYYIMLGIFVVMMITAYLIRHSKFGLALQSIGENEEAAAHTGINVTLVKIVTFAISAVFMGAAGAIWAPKLTYIDPYIAFNILLSFMPVLMALFGGMGQLYGPVLGALIFTYLDEILITEYPFYSRLIFGIILVIAILFLPNGIVGLIQKLWKRVSGGQHVNT